MIRHISFDVWKTLFQPNLTFSATRSDHVAEVLRLPKDHVRAVYKTTKDNFDKVAEATGAGWSSEVVYRTLLENLGFADHPWEAICVETERLFLEHPPIILDRNIEVIAELRRRGYTLSIGSNTNFASGRVLGKVLADRFGPWDYMVFSDLMGHCSKPHADFFQEITRQARLLHTDISAEEILHVGDNPVCDGAAKDHGMHIHIISGPETLETVLDAVP